MKLISNLINNFGITKSILTDSCSCILILVAGVLQGKLPNCLGCFITEVLFALGTGLFSSTVVIYLYKIYKNKVNCEMTERFYYSIWGASNQIIDVLAELGIDIDIDTTEQ